MFGKIRVYGLILPFLAFASVKAEFTPIPLSIQVQHSDGAIEGVFLQLASKRNLQGELFFEARFHLTAIGGIPQSKIINKKNFKIYYPASIYAPQFEIGEKVIILLKKSIYGFQPADGVLSVYTVVEEDGGPPLLQNKAFAHHHELGNIPLSYLNELLTTRFSSLLTSSGLKSVRL